MEGHCSMIPEVWFGRIPSVAHEEEVSSSGVHLVAESSDVSNTDYLSCSLMTGATALLAALYCRQ